MSTATCQDTSFLKGYYITIYNTHDVKRLQKESKFSRLKKTHNAQMDPEIQDFFIPNEGSGFDLTNRLRNLLIKDKRELFVPCSPTILRNVDHFICHKSARDNYSCQWPSLKSNKYYRLKKSKNKYCYQIFELDGYWINTVISSDTEKRIVGKGVRFIDQNMPVFKAYIFVKYENHNNAPSINNQNIYLWKTL